MHTHVCVRRFDVCVCIHGPVYAIGVLEAMKDNFFFLALKLGFGMNPTSFGSHSKPPFFNYIKHNTVYFKNAQKILRENLRFTRNPKSKREFFTKYPQINFLLIRTFYHLDLRVLKFTTQFC